MAKRKSMDSEEVAVPERVIAKKDWRILSGKWDRKTGKQEVDIQVKKGQDISDLDKKFLDILKSENVI